MSTPLNREKLKETKELITDNIDNDLLLECLPKIDNADEYYDNFERDFPQFLQVPYKRSYYSLNNCEYPKLVARYKTFINKGIDVFCNKMELKYPDNTEYVYYAINHTNSGLSKSLKKIFYSLVSVENFLYRLAKASKLNITVRYTLPVKNDNVLKVDNEKYHNTYLVEVLKFLGINPREYNKDFPNMTLRKNKKIPVYILQNFYSSDHYVNSMLYTYGTLTLSEIFQAYFEKNSYIVFPEGSHLLFQNLEKDLNNYLVTSKEIMVKFETIHFAYEIYNCKRDFKNVFPEIELNKCKLVNVIKQKYDE
jgi:hypothetical protein